MIKLPLETPRLRIRHLEDRDLQAYLRFMLDEESTKYLAFEPADKTHDGALALFQFIIQSYSSEEPVHAFAIEDLRSGEYVGSCGFAPYEEGVLECYYCVDSNQRGRGIAVEATNALLAALAPIAEVRAFCHTDNLAAHAVAQRCGMKPLGAGTNKNTGLKGLVFAQMCR
jgi:[ribosomal protein S5]-alanine N-acetyltransferase